MRELAYVLLHISIFLQHNAMEIIDRTTSVDCEKDVHCWRSLRSLLEFMVPCCGSSCQSMTGGSVEGHDNSNAPLAQ
jgi:hypothetical protein